MKQLFAILILSAICFAQVWQAEIIEDHTGIGSECDIEIDSSNNLCVSYEYMHGHLGSSAVKYAFNENDSGPWVLTTVGSGDYTGYFNELALDSSDNPHISYAWDVDWEYIPMLNYASYNGSSWNIESLTGTGEYVEANTTIGIDSNNYPHIIYNNTGGLNHRWQDASGWNYELVSSGSCESPHLVIDSNDNIHVIFSRAATDEMTYAVKNTGWSFEVVETTTGFYESSDIDMVLDSNGYAHVVYRAGEHDLRYASNNGSGWNVENIHTDALGYPSIDIDSAGGLHVSFSIYTTESNRPLVYSYNSGSGWVTVEIDPTVKCWNTAIAVDNNDIPHIIYYDFSDGLTKHAWLDPMGIDDTASPVQLTGFALHPVYPNPSNGNATITFTTPHAADVNLSIYDITGRKVTTLVDEALNEGSHSAIVTDLTSGIYFYRLTTDTFTSTEKLVVSR